MVRNLEFNIDIKNKRYLHADAMQDDDILLTLNVDESGQAKDLTGSIIQLDYCKGDNSVVSITGSKYISIENNVVSIVCPRECTAAIGESRCNIVISSDDKQVSSFPISINVVANALMHKRVSKRNLATMLDELHEGNLEAQALVDWIKEHENILDIEKNIENLSSQIDEIEKQEIRTVILEKAVEDKVQEKINDGYMSALTIADKSIDASEKIIEGSVNLDLLNENLQGEYINLFSESDENLLVGKGISGTTGDIVVANQFNITGYIFLDKGDKLYCTVNEKDIFQTTLMNKIAIYDVEKNWEKTINIKNDTITALIAEKDCHIRVQYYNNSTTNYQKIFISSSRNKKISKKNVDYFSEDINLLKNKEENLNENLKKISENLDGLDIEKIEIDSLNKIINPEQVTIDTDKVITFSDTTGEGNTYNWFYIKFDKDVEFINLTNAQWIVILALNDNVIAFNNTTGACRKFTKTGRVELGTLGTKVLNIFSYAYKFMKIETDDLTHFNIYIKSTQADNYSLCMTIDLSSLDIADYSLAFGIIQFNGNLNTEILKNINISVFNNDLKKIIKSLKSNVLENTNMIEKFMNTGSFSNIVDLVMFMGQSNMAGRGVAEEAPIVQEGYGYEFRAISDPTKLYNIVEPFGVNENNSASGISESSKTGSMVSSFVKAYYEATKVPIVAVSCSKGGTVIEWWQPDGEPLNDAINRHNTAKEWLVNNGYKIRHDFMVWCQGESNGNNSTTGDNYKSKLNTMVEEMMNNGIEKCFLVRIGEINSSTTPNKYDEIISAQTEICKENSNFVLVGTKFAGMRERGLMKDSFHYVQQGYNEQGEEAGKNTAFFINNMKEPIIYDVKYDNLYYSKK